MMRFGLAQLCLWATLLCCCWQHATSKTLVIEKVYCKYTSKGSYTDDLYIKVNGKKVWPSGKYEEIDEGATKYPNARFEFDGDGWMVP